MSRTAPRAPAPPHARAFVGRALVAGGLGMAAGGAAGAWAWGRRGMCFDDAHDPYVEKARIAGAVMVGTGLVAAVAGSVLLLLSTREQRQLGAWRGRAAGILSGGAVAFAALGLGVVTFASVIEWAECNSS